jgi:hypothetical protein
MVMTNRTEAMKAGMRSGQEWSAVAVNDLLNRTTIRSAAQTCAEVFSTEGALYDAYVEGFIATAMDARDARQRARDRK